jgi:hypothetical protein
MGFELVGKVFDIPNFEEYLTTVDMSWADSVCVHHTASPSLAQRPEGWKIEHIFNLEDYYSNQLGWSSGPHLFTDEESIFAMSSLWRRGVHSVSFNHRSIGVECLGNYDDEDPKSGRGLACMRNTAMTVGLILDAMGLPANEETVLFHRDDPSTNKTCPGRKVDKDWFLSLINCAIEELTMEQRMERVETHLGL